MQLVLGGAFAGKRKLVKERYKSFSWISAYEGNIVKDWETKWTKSTTLVLEGWENWILEEVKQQQKTDTDIREEYRILFQRLLEAEQNRGDTIVLIMLDIGKGIVPLQKDERRQRDLAGWIGQDAAQLSDHVEYVWNGLSRRLK